MFWASNIVWLRKRAPSDGIGMNDVGCIVAIRPRFLCTMPCCHITDEKDTPERSSCLARPLARLMIKSSYDPIRRPGIAWPLRISSLRSPSFQLRFTRVDGIRRPVQEQIEESKSFL